METQAAIFLGVMMSVVAGIGLLITPHITVLLIILGIAAVAFGVFTSLKVGIEFVLAAAILILIVAFTE